MMMSCCARRVKAPSWRRIARSCGMPALSETLCRYFSDGPNGGEDGLRGVGRDNWRKQRLKDLEMKFRGSSSDEDEAGDDDDEEGDEDADGESFRLQSEWRAMESRVTRRRLKTVEEAGNRPGRSNIKKTDEDKWLEAGLWKDQRREER